MLFALNLCHVLAQESINRVKASIIELENVEETQTEDVSSLVCILYAVILICLNHFSICLL